jgi:hypothetical protein
MNISGIFIRRPIGTSLLAMGLFAVGAICYFLLGVSALPAMQFPAIFVQASQSGADASTMASTVASIWMRRPALCWRRSTPPRLICPPASTARPATRRPTPTTTRSSPSR